MHARRPIVLQELVQCNILTLHPFRRAYSSEKKINHNNQSNYPIAKQSAVENKTKNNFSIASDSYVDPKDYPIRNNIAKKQANSFGFSTYNPSQINMIIIPKNQEFYKDVIDKFNNWLVNLCEYFNPMPRP